MNYYCAWYNLNLELVLFILLYSLCLINSSINNVLVASILVSDKQQKQQKKKSQINESIIRKNETPNNYRYLVLSSNELQELDSKLFEKKKEVNFGLRTTISPKSIQKCKRAVFTKNNCINIDSQNVCRQKLLS